MGFAANKSEDGPLLLTQVPVHLLLTAPHPESDSPTLLQ